MDASREIFWHIPLFVQIISIPVSRSCVLLIGYAVYRRYQMWMLGKPDKRFDHPGKRIGEFIKITILDAIFHVRFFRDPYPGIMHFLIFIGCILAFPRGGPRLPEPLFICALRRGVHSWPGIHLSGRAVEYRRHYGAGWDWCWHLSGGIFRGLKG